MSERLTRILIIAIALVGLLACGTTSTGVSIVTPTSPSQRLPTPTFTPTATPAPTAVPRFNQAGSGVTFFTGTVNVSRLDCGGAWSLIDPNRTYQPAEISAIVTYLSGKRGGSSNGLQYWPGGDPSCKVSLEFVNGTNFPEVISGVGVSYTATPVANPLQYNKLSQAIICVNRPPGALAQGLGGRSTSLNAAPHMLTQPAIPCSIDPGCDVTLSLSPGPVGSKIAATTCDNADEAQLPIQIAPQGDAHFNLTLESASPEVYEVSFTLRVGLVGQTAGDSVVRDSVTGKGIVTSAVFVASPSIIHCYAPNSTNTGFVPVSGSC
jgi:hypothetical protein